MVETKEQGVAMGAISTVLLYVGTVWIASTLCKAWDDHKVEKKQQKSVTQSSTDTICFCRKCGDRLITNSDFCRKCGTEIVEE